MTIPKIVTKGLTGSSPFTLVYIYGIKNELKGWERDSSPAVGKMNILHVNICKSWCEGESQLLQLGRVLQKRGHHLWIGAPPKSRLFLKSAEFRLATVPIWGGRVFKLLEALKIGKTVERNRIDILHLHGLISLRFGLWVKRFTKAEVIVVLSLREVPPSFKKGRRLRERGGVEQTVVNSKVVQKKLESDGIPSERLSLIYDGVDLIRFSPSVKPFGLFREYSLPPEMTVIGYVAPSLCNKGERTLIEAAREVVSLNPETIFLIVGESKKRKDLEALIEQYALSENFIFCGFSERMPAILAALDLFVLPAVEGSPALTILEAMATAVPVITADLPGVKELIKDGVNGMIVPPANPHALARAIMEFMEDRRRWKVMGQEGRRAAEAQFDLNKTVRETEELYQQLIKKRGQQGDG